MRRFLLILTLAVCVPSTVCASVAGADAPRANLRGVVCQHALDPAGRAISLTAVMRPVPGTKKMAMRFELLKRSNRKSPATSLAGRDLKTWLSPNPSTLGQLPGDKWILHHPVVNLAAPALYRFRVSFRWTGSGGRVLGTATKLGPVCFQPELRADLVVQPAAGLKVVRLASGQDRYTVTVGNRGKTAAGPFNMALAIGTSQPIEQPIQQLAPHTHAVVHLVGPACAAGDQLTVTADPEEKVDDAYRDNNVLSGTCPTPSASASAKHRHRAL